MKWLWMLLLIPVLYVVFLFADSPVHQRTIIGEVIGVKNGSTIIKTKKGNIESIPKLDYKLGQEVDVDILQTRISGKLLYQYTNTLHIEVSTNNE